MVGWSKSLSKTGSDWFKETCELAFDCLFWSGIEIFLKKTWYKGEIASTLLEHL